MNLGHGGHLTHGSPVNFSGKLYHFEEYGVDPETETIDYDAMEKKALEVQPKLIVAGASAYPRIIDFARIREICDKCGALMMVDMAHIAGIVAAGRHPNPCAYADIVTTTTHKTLRGPRGGMILCKEKNWPRPSTNPSSRRPGRPARAHHRRQSRRLGEALTDEFKAYQHQIILNARALAEGFTAAGLRMVSGGTDNHLILLNLTGTGVTGKELEKRLDAANITVNKNTVPFETLSPFVTSGIRVGTPAVTTRGMKAAEMAQIASWIARLTHEGDTAIDAVKAEVLELTRRFPLYENDILE